VPQVNAAFDAHPILRDRDKYLARTLALELVELDELGEVFRAKAIDEQDVAAGALLTKIHERRATLLGLNAPQSAAVQIIEHTAPPAMNSTERIYAAIERIAAMKKPQNGGDESEPQHQ
jgi:hypothetical protein